MDYNKIGLWATGYLEALTSGESVSKLQLEKLINRIQEMISNIEESSISAGVSALEEVEDF